MPIPTTPSKLTQWLAALTQWLDAETAIDWRHGISKPTVVDVPVAFAWVHGSRSPANARSLDYSRDQILRLIIQYSSSGASVLPDWEMYILELISGLQRTGVPSQVVNIGGNNYTVDNSFVGIVPSSVDGRNGGMFAIHEQSLATGASTGNAAKIDYKLIMDFIYPFPQSFQYRKS